MLNEAKEENPLNISYKLDHCDPIDQESYKLMISYRVRKNRVIPIFFTRTCYGIVVQVRPEEKDVPRIQIMKHGECVQS